jgi:hypothetical protein
MDVIDITEDDENNITFNSLTEIPNVDYKFCVNININVIFYNNIKD